MRWQLLTFLSFLSAMVEGCTNPSSTIYSKTKNQPPDQTLWVSKLTQALSLTPQWDNDFLMEISLQKEEDIVNYFLEHTDFEDVIFDFHRFFLGGNNTSPVVILENNQKTYDPGVQLLNPAALAATHAYAKGQDIFSSLFATQHKTHIRFSILYSPTGDSAQQTPEIRRLHLFTWRSHLKNFNNTLETADSSESFCKSLSAFSFDLGQITEKFGISFGAYDGFFADSWVTNNFPLLHMCSLGQYTTAFTLEQAQAEIRELERFLDYLETQLETLTGYSQGPLWQTTLQAPADIPGLKHTKSHLFEGGWYLERLNSSTNHNRRRAAAVLDTFFCDDLTPTSVVLGDSHGSGAHGTQPSCASCHYKLDPMAGIFRNVGFLGDTHQVPYLKSLTFDDGKVIASNELSNYLNQWKDIQGNWRSGWIRSTTNPSLNVSLESPLELLKFAQTSPEVSKCYVKRLSQYFLGKNQQVDPGYLDSLHSHFEDLRKTQGSSLALRATVKSLMLSNTFAQANPQPNTCYDLSPQTPQGSKAVPCSVSYLIQKNCSTCHAGPGGSGNLDLTNVVSQEPVTFYHLDSQGNQRSAKQSFQILQDRLHTTNTQYRMPLLKHMDDADRLALSKWFESNTK